MKHSSTVILFPRNLYSCLEWIFSYISNRSFVVSRNNFYSNFFPFPFEIPQNSVLGPLFFIFYFSELSRIVSSFSFQSQLHTDDSKLFFIFKYNSSFNISNISSCMGKIISWSDSMFLKLNPCKFDFICFSKSQLIESLPLIEISSNLSLAHFSAIPS